LRGISQKANSDAAFRVTSGVPDLMNPLIFQMTP